MIGAAANRSPEQNFLEWFSSSFQGKGLESRFMFGSLHSYCTSFSESFCGHEIAGHGHDADASRAALKGAAELLERRAAIEYFRRNPGELFQNTNGWAAHLTRASAISNACREAVERHILLYTFLRSEWREFVLLDRREAENGFALFLASPFIQNGYFGGMVVYHDHRLPGVSFGHLADDASKIDSSPHWNHALFEAVAFVGRGLETGSLSRDSKNSFHKESCAWFHEPWNELEWKSVFAPAPLPDVKIDIESGLVSELTPSCAGLYYARVKPGEMLPLFLPSDLANQSRKEYLLDACCRHGISLRDGRIPIL